MNGDGVIKFSYRHRVTPSLSEAGLRGLMELRERLHGLRLIGITPEGVGYGNVSRRLSAGFCISASQTGGVAPLGADGYALVEAWDIGENSLVSSGPKRPSSESLSHAAVYEASPEIRWTAHVHSARLFSRLLEKGTPATPSCAAYGTPDMARAAKQITRAAGPEGVLVMTGHADGVLFWGKELKSALDSVIMPALAECGIV